MKVFKRILFLLTVMTLIACGGKEEKQEEKIKLKSTKTETKKEPVSTTKASEVVDLTNKGIGPVKELKLPESIDMAMAKEGEEAFKLKCMACHKPDRKFIGPSPLNILERRTPEWVMNMILNPQEMVEKDPLAKQLLIEFNGSPMANQSLTEQEARSILEYFRTIEPETK